MSMRKRGCEARLWSSGETCGFPAFWCVQAGTRKADAQDSCHLHLAATCRAMLGAECVGRSLTVTRITP